MTTITSQDLTEGRDSLENRSLYTWAGRAGLIASLAYIATIVAANLGSPEPADGVDDIVRYLLEVADNRWRPLLYGVSGVVMSLLFMPLAPAVRRAFGRTTRTELGALALVVGLAFLIPAYTVAILEGTVFASAAEDLGADGSHSLFVAYELSEVALIVFFTIGSILTLGVAPMLWALEARHNELLPRWLTISGLVVGVTGLVWLVWFLSDLALIVLLVNVVASLVFFIGLSFWVASKGRPAS